MHYPQQGDYIDIHIHNGKASEGVFILESLMAHEDHATRNIPGIAYTFGIHPWFLNENNFDLHLALVKNNALSNNIAAIGEAGFDKLRGPSLELQGKVFEEQVIISEKHLKPLVIHCVKGWDELLSSHRKLRPKMPWLVHGFRGRPELAKQLLSKGMYLSIWFEFVLRPESARLLRSLPKNRLFLETDGADVDIREIYEKVSYDLDISVDELKKTILANYNTFFQLNHQSKV